MEVVQNSELLSDRVSNPCTWKIRNLGTMYELVQSLIGSQSVACKTPPCSSSCHKTVPINPLQDIVAAHNLDSMYYADDSQLYIAINPNDHSPELNTLRSCIDDVITWNTRNMLLCNPGKTEVIQFTSRFVRNPVIDHFSCGNTEIELSDKVRDLGVIMDKELNLRSHVNDICKKAILAIRSVSRMRKYLSQDNLKRIVNAFVISRLDYCNSVLYGLPKLVLEKIQRIQKIAAHLITGTNRMDHITPVLRDLHWLPIKSRIVFTRECNEIAVETDMQIFTHSLVRLLCKQ